MAKYLVIVESPAKAKTIHKYLGSNYTVIASNGHVRDLPKSQLGIDVAHDYEPKYITIRGKGDILAALRKEVKKADKVYLATDPDREGEAISWHLSQALKLDDKTTSRITFNEITKKAVKNSLKAARKIDMGLVDAQQARRILDRMVGYTISPLLWAKVKRGLSAGRVQSVALRLICDREQEIEAFVPEAYWTLDVRLQAGGKEEIVAHYSGKDGKKQQLDSREELDAVLADLEDAVYTVADIRTGERTRKAPLPFTTSTLQQEASKRLNFSTQKTMRLAQQLYEGIEVKGEGQVGLITYLRTDSTRVSDEAVAAAADYIKKNYGEAYAAGTVRDTSNGRHIQDAHEAIRPTDLALSPARIKESLSRDQLRLYQLIWNRFLGSRMNDAVYETLTVRIAAGKHIFSAVSSRVKFDGYMSVYRQEDDQPEKSSLSAKHLEKGQELEFEDLDAKEHFTQPPAHYTEASLVRTLEELGIGRPSTYAPTITTILARRYVIKEKKNLYVTELGEVVNRIMTESFPTIVNVEFTANMEYLLDKVEEGTIQYKTIIRNFYPDLEASVEKAQKELEHVKLTDEVSDVVCDQCGRMMVFKYGPHGKFLACPGFPECRNTKTWFEKIGVKCPQCGGEIVVRKTKKGRRYYGCEHNPECDYMTWKRPVSGEAAPAKSSEEEMGA